MKTLNETAESSSIKCPDCNRHLTQLSGKHKMAVQIDSSSICECGHEEKEHASLKICENDKHGLVEDCTDKDCLKKLKGLKCYCSEFKPKRSEE